MRGGAVVETVLPTGSGGGGGTTIGGWYGENDSNFLRAVFDLVNVDGPIEFCSFASSDEVGDE